MLGAALLEGPSNTACLALLSNAKIILITFARAVLERFSPTSPSHKFPYRGTIIMISA